MSEGQSMGAEKRTVITLPVSGKSAPLIPVPKGEWLDLVFPAVVRDTDKALNMLNCQLSQTTVDVQVKMRPNNPSCIPIKSKVTVCNKLVLKVNKKTQKVTVVGQIKKEVVFNKLADFQLQYTPAPPTPSGNGQHPSLIDFDYLTKDAKFRVNCMQHSFKDAPVDYFFQALAPGDLGKVSATSEVRTRPSRPSIVIHWKTTDVGVPGKPLKDLGDSVFRQNYFNQHKDRIEELFQKRPIWSTGAFSNHMQMSEINLRTNLLPYFAYYCSVGPWRNMWIRFGYDPRLSAINRKYQLIDYRAPRNFISKNNIQRYSANKKDSAKLKKCHIYTKSELPIKRQSHYQVCDIQDTQCQAVLSNFETNTFTQTDGFYLSGATPAVREVMNEQVNALFAKEDQNPTT